MGGDGLRRLGELALDRHLSSRLPEAVLEFLAGEANAAKGVLLRGATVVARRGEAGDDEASWAEFELLPGPRPWRVRLPGAAGPGEAAVAAARLALRSWELREELRASRLGERLRLWELDALRTLASAIVGILDVETLGEELTTSLVMLMGVRRAELLIGEGPEEARRVALFGDPPSEGVDLATVWERGVTGERLLARPLTTANETLGLVLVADKEARTGSQPFSSEDGRLLELFAVQAAIALENARLYRASIEKERLDRELEVAAEVQAYLQPPGFPEMAGYRVVTFRRPARFVAGDCFTVGPRPGGIEALLADVSGKGVGAGLLAASLQSGARLLADLEEPLRVTASRLDQTLYETTKSHQFATGILVRCEAGGTATIVNAGHPPALLLRANGGLERLESTGLPLGLLPGSRYDEITLRLEPGDRIVLYTDGLTEAEDPSGEELGVDRLARIVADAADSRSELLCGAIVEEVERFARGVPFADDVTLMLIERSADEKAG